MNQKSLNWGIGITVVWLAVIVAFWIFGGVESPSSLNELGDFLAGIFAPVAFFWLILGYVQQGKQLDQNTEALEQQERALQLQIEEMKESVKQQVYLVDLQREQFNAASKAVRPQFSLSRGTFFEHEEMYEDRDEAGEIIDIFEIYIVCIYVNLKNYGEEAKNILWQDDSHSDSSYILMNIHKDDEKRIQINLTQEQYSELFSTKELVINGRLRYEDKYGNKYDFKIQFFISHPNKSYQVKINTCNNEN